MVERESANKEGVAGLVQGLFGAVEETATFAIVQPILNKAPLVKRKSLEKTSLECDAKPMKMQRED